MPHRRSIYFEYLIYKKVQTTQIYTHQESEFNLSPSIFQLNPKFNSTDYPKMHKTTNNKHKR